MKFAYADPPYLGKAGRLYGALHPEAAEYDRPAAHGRLIDEMKANYPDGWALSLSSTSLRAILPLCPEGVRVMAWVKPFCSYKPGVNPAYAWEPVIVCGGRRRTRQQDTVRDWVAANITLRRGFCGAKPAEFCYWLFDVLGMEPEDEFADLFPGSGAVTAAWEAWRSRYTRKPGQMDFWQIPEKQMADSAEA